MNKETKPIMLMVGFPGTGKSYLADKIKSKLKSYDIFCTCGTRKILGITVYDPKDTDRVVAHIYDSSRKAINSRRNVIIDSTYNTRIRRNEVYDLANEMKVPVLVIECICAEDIVRQRILNRAEKDKQHILKDPSKNQKRTWEDVPKDLMDAKNSHVSFIKYHTDTNEIEEIKINPELASFIDKIKGIIIEG